jgi:hypothetical protein
MSKLIDLNSMTSAELRVLADKKEREEKASKIGFVREDIRILHYSSYNLVFPNSACTLLEFNKLTEDFIRRVKANTTLVPKGTKFYCDMNEGYESWSEETGKIVGMDGTWALVYLDDLQFRKKV